MTATDLLADMNRAGIELQADGDKLRYRPLSAMTPDLAERLKACKPELLALLNKTPDIPARPPARPGYFVGLTFSAGRGAWQQHRIDAAHRAWFTYQRAF